ncbi:MAG: nitric oxide reductase activation protein [Eubacteriaceae bacterium]|nr:nitric oxide reductase activation protein [Eubacteriaceae bacterium]
MSLDHSTNYSEFELELENRIRNLMWTVSGNYGLNEKADLEAFKISKYIAMYDAIWKGALAKYFDRNAISLYIAKKLYLGASEALLFEAVALCGEAASYKKAIGERPGVEAIRSQAFDDLLDLSYDRLSNTTAGRIRLAMIRYYLTGETRTYKSLQQACETIASIEHAQTALEIIAAIDALYNGSFDKDFELKHGDLGSVLDVSIAELRQSSLWSDIFDDEIYQNFDQAVENISSAVMGISTLTEEDKASRKASQARVIINEEALAKAHQYIEINYGTSYLSQRETQRIENAVCKGMHQGYGLHFTEGVLHSDGPNNYQRKYITRQHEKNMMVFYDNYRLVRKNIAILTSFIKNEMELHDQAETRITQRGMLVPHRVWRVGRTNDPKLFRQTVAHGSYGFVVDVLIDGSGSQNKRQSKVALQSYIISEALSNVKIPHRVASFCSFWSHTIIRRFRDYGDPREMNSRVLEFSASSNNRDGLAIMAIVESLLKREEENKILIVLSDGRPNDININNPYSVSSELYTGNAAIADTAHQVRFARASGISVLGVFTGKEEDLQAEKKIFGNDFAYIRDIDNFSKLVGLYLKKQLDNLL